MLPILNNCCSKQDDEPNGIEHQITGRNTNFHHQHYQHYEDQGGFQSYSHQKYHENAQNMKNTDNNSSADRSSSSTIPDIHAMIPNPKDVKTIALQMRTMPNYFAAMVAAASVNACCPNSPIISEEDEMNTSNRRSDEEIPGFRSKYPKEQSPNTNGASVPTRNQMVKKESSQHLTSSDVFSPKPDDMV